MAKAEDTEEQNMGFNPLLMLLSRVSHVSYAHFLREHTQHVDKNLSHAHDCAYSVAISSESPTLQSKQYYGKKNC